MSVNPDSMDGDALRKAVWGALEPRYLARLRALCEAFGNAQADHKGTSDLSDAARAAVQGRVRTLLVEDGRVRAGRIDGATGAIEPDALDHSEVGDMLDDLAEIVLRTGGEVVIVPEERMPSTTGLAAVFGY